MEGPMADSDLEATIRRMFYADHWQIHAIASRLDIHPDVVRSAVNIDSFSNQRVGRPSMVDPFVPFIKHTLSLHPKLTATATAADAD